MLPLVVIEEVQRLLDEGQLSQRKIAERLKVSRGTVGAIARGQRGLHGKGTNPSRVQVSHLKMPPERCCCCGGLVYKPCLLCKTRAYRRRKKSLIKSRGECRDCPRKVA